MNWLDVLLDSQALRSVLFPVMMVLTLGSLVRKYVRQRRERQPPRAVTDAFLRELVGRGERYRAIRVYRDHHRSTPEQARQAIEAIEASMAAAPAAAPETAGSVERAHEPEADRTPS